jgi:hypothetical protein
MLWCSLVWHQRAEDLSRWHELLESSAPTNWNKQILMNVTVFNNINSRLRMHLWHNRCFHIPAVGIWYASSMEYRERESKLWHEITMVVMNSITNI